MDQDCPLAGGVLDAFREMAAQRKGRPSIKTLDAAKGSGSRTWKGSAGPSSKSKKQPREGSNIATTSSPDTTTSSRAFWHRLATTEWGQQGGRPTRDWLLDGGFYVTPSGPRGWCGLHFLRPPEMWSGSSRHRTCWRGVWRCCVGPLSWSSWDLKTEIAMPRRYLG